MNSSCSLTAGLLRSLLLVLLVAPGLARAQTVPPLVNFQGRLANPDGTPLPTADYQLTFRIYDAPTNGTLIWGPQVFDGAAAQGHGPRIPVVQGYFNVMLGPVDVNGMALSEAFNGTSRFVETTVTNGPPILPRQQVLTTPFAFKAADSMKLAGYDWTALLSTNDPMTGTIPFAKLTRREVGTNVGVGGVALSLSSGSGQWNSQTPTTPTAITNLRVSIETRGGPVLLFLSSGSPNLAAFIGVQDNGNDGVALMHVELLRDGESAGIYWQKHEDYNSGGNDPDIQVAPSTFKWIDHPPAGAHTYVIRAWNTDTGSTYARNIRLVAFEL